MDSSIFNPDPLVSLFVKSILVFEENDSPKTTVLPFFADGYPGLLYREAKNGLFVKPHNKEMPVLFLYGQTVQPVELVFKGNYRMIVFQLFPFVIKNLFGVQPKDLTDNCYDLSPLQNPSVSIMETVSKEQDVEKRVALLTSFLYSRFQARQNAIDPLICKAVETIIDKKGQSMIKELCGELGMHERTLERRFSEEVGLSPKQFAQIIRFQQSMEQLASKDYSKLTDIVYSNGYTDQSHFIKVFKSYTGRNPSSFAKTGA
jgi:AraC-like DNA-binding protein